MKPRKIIQIAVSGVKNTQETQCNYIVVALCDDGTVWDTSGTQPVWCGFPPIPQEPRERSQR